MENNRIVIDANVVISSAITKRQDSPPYLIMNEIVAAGDFEICVSDEILKEYREKPSKKRFFREKHLTNYPNFQQDINRHLEVLRQISIHVKPEQKLSIITDESDNRYLEVAVEADAFCIITGNHKHFKKDEYEGIKIFLARDFYEWWKENY